MKIFTGIHFVARLPRAALFAALLTIALAGCGGESATTNSPTPPATTPPLPTPPPPAPGSSPNSALLEWNPSAEPSVVGYRIYYGTAPRTYQQPHGSGIAVAGTSYRVAGHSSGTLYHFAVTTFDDAGNESDFSDEVSKVMP